MIGTLNSKAMDDNGVMVARIDEKPYKVLSYVLPFLERIETGAQVEVTITQDDRISKINRVRQQQRDPETAQKMSKAGFGEPQTQSAEQIKKEHDEYNARARGTPTDQPGVSVIGGVNEVKAPAGGIEGIVAATKAKAQEEKKDCTSSITPTQSGLKTVEGQITAINYEKRGLAVKDKAGDSHPFYWSELFKMVNYKGEPLQQWWFVRITAELRTSDDTWWVTAQEYFKKPEDWPKSQAHGGGRQFVPRNEKPMAYESAFKTCAELVRPDDFPGMTYDQRVEAVRITADKIARWIVESGGC
jgi:hypothetical protein